MGEKESNEHDAGQLSIFLKEVVQCLAKLKHEVPGLDIFTLKTPEQIQDMIHEMLRFPAMSFLELHYRLSGVQAKPGIRFLLEKSGSGRQVRSILFRDIVFWHVDNNLSKIEKELVIFRLNGKEIQATPSQILIRQFGAAEDWRTSLRQALVFAIPSDSDAGH